MSFLLMKNIPIVILHGWKLSSSYYNLLVNVLKRKGFTVICFDLPGFGKTKTPINPLTLSDYVEFVLKKIKSAKFSKVIIVGHSFGGRIGIKMAAEYPQLIHKLILTGTPGINPIPMGKVLFFRCLAKSGKILLSIPMISVFKPLLRSLLHRIAGAYDYSKTDGMMRITFNNIIREDLKLYMGRLKIPTLLLWGEVDQIVPLNIAKQMNRLINKSDLKLISLSGHEVIKSKANEFANLLTAFLDKK